MKMKTTQQNFLKHSERMLRGKLQLEMLILNKKKDLKLHLTVQIKELRKEVDTKSKDNRRKE